MTQRVVNYTYATGNPVLPDGSIDVRDGIDNLQSMDVFMNAPEDTYNQRDGEIVRTVAGMNKEFDAQILNMGFTRIGTFASGATLTNPRQTLLWDIADGGDGQEYGWSGAFPKVVPATSTPASTGGISVGAWISRFDPSLRIQTREALRRSYSEAGYNLVDGSFEAGGTLANADDVLLQERTGKAFSGPAGAVAAGTNPASGGFVDKSGALLNVNLLAGALQMRDSRFALRDVVSIEDFDDATDTAKFANAFSYLTSNFGGGAVIVPPKVWMATVDVPDNVMLIGFGEKSVIKAASTGDGSYAVKISNSEVGVYPYGAGKTPVKNAKLQNINIDANGADFGLYAAYCLFPDWEGVNISNAKVRNLYMTAVFSYSIDKMLLSSCQSVGGSIGENIFGWTGGDEGIICNAGNSRRLIAFGNGTTATYDKVSAPRAGVGLIVRGGSSNSFTSFQGEGNKGPGLYVMPGTQASFHGIYLEANANDGSSEFRQVVNESSAAMFYDVEPRFNSTDVFYAAADSYIFNYLGARITGPGYVSLYGKFNNVTVANPLVHTVKLSEATNVDSAGASTRHTILKPSRYSTSNGYKTGVWQMGVFIAFRSAQTVLSGKSILVRTLGGVTLSTLNLPAGTYADGDVVYLPLLIENTTLESLSVVNLGYGAGWVGIGQIDIGMYVQIVV